MPTYPQLTVTPRPMRGPAGVFAIETPEHGEVAWLPMYHPDAESLARLFAAAPGLVAAATEALAQAECAVNAAAGANRAETLRRLADARSILLGGLVPLETGDPYERTMSYAEPVELCRVEGCGLPQCAGRYTCAMHHEGAGVLWWFCVAEDCWRRSTSGRCGLHGGADYQPTPEVYRCEALGCMREASPGARYCDFAHDGLVLYRCLVRGCRGRPGGNWFCPEHRIEYVASRSSGVFAFAASLPPLPAPTRISTTHRCEASGCEREAAAGARYCVASIGSLPHPGREYTRCLLRRCGERAGGSWLCVTHEAARHATRTSAWQWVTANAEAPAVPTPPRPAPSPLPLPATVTTHGLPGGTDTGAVETALLAAGVPGGEGLDDDAPTAAPAPAWRTVQCLSCELAAQSGDVRCAQCRGVVERLNRHSGTTQTAPSVAVPVHRCEREGCARDALVNGRCCGYHDSNICDVLWCSERRDRARTCTAHWSAYVASPIARYRDWLTSLTPPPPTPAPVPSVAPTGHRCEYAGCIAEAQDGARCCRAHICPNLCNVRWCEGMYDGLLCSAHRLAYLASPLNYYNWLASLTPPPPAPAPAIRAGDLVAVDSGGTVRTANAGSPVLGVAMGTAAPGETVTVALHNLPGCPAFVSFVASGERVGFALEWVEDPAPDARARYLAGLTPAQRAGLAPLGGGR
jgi:hypothetical protein